MNDTPAPPAAPAPRANRRGHLCPSWCQTDHAWRDGLLAAHTASAGDIAIGDTGRYDADMIYLHLIHVTGAGPAVNLRGYRHGMDHRQDPSASVPPDGAEGLAGVIEMLAAATPDQHREIAAAIRAAAAVITAAEDPDAPVRA